MGKSSAVRHFHLRKSAFTFDHSISIGFISGLYGGRYRSHIGSCYKTRFELLYPLFYVADSCQL